MAERGLLLFDNALWRPGTVLTASSEASASTGVAKLLDYRPKRPWVTTSKTDEHLLVDFGEKTPIDTVFIYAMGATNEAEANIQIASAADMSGAVYGQVHDIWPPPYGYGDQYGQNYGGYADLTEFKAFTQRRLIRLGTTYEERYLKIGLTDPEAANDFLSTGIIWAGIGTQLSRNFALPADFDWTDPTEHQETDGDTVIIQPRASYREESFGFELLNRAEAFTEMDDFKRIVGRKRPAIWAPFVHRQEPPADDDPSLSLIYRTMIYGLVTGGGPISLTNQLHADVMGIRIRELAAPGVASG